MHHKGPIVLVEDDLDDKGFFTDTLKKLSVPNELVWFEDAESAYQYLEETRDKVFIIFCDINLPGQNGLDFKKQIDHNAELRRKSIPFVFYSTAARQEDVNEAYVQMTVQGFFRKQSDFNKMEQQLELILNYWQVCIHPNTQ
jgi:response regulator RpfG family c-di-GMP phosphodiesterase